MKRTILNVRLERNSIIDESLVLRVLIATLKSHKFESTPFDRHFKKVRKAIDTWTHSVATANVVIDQKCNGLR